MKVSAMFLMFVVSVFLPAAGLAQDNYFVPQKDCSSFMSTGAVEELAYKQDCLNGNQKQLKTSVEDLRFRTRANEIDILMLKDKFKVDVHTDESRIEALEAHIHLLEARLAMAEDEIGWLSRKTPPNKPKPAATKSAPGTKTTTH